ncbi:MAG: OmpA family protein [Pseudoruegeria sp.]
MGAIVAVAALSLGGAVAEAQETKTIIGEKRVPTIWVDPDGCEHWVMDDGWEGYMSPHVKRDGRPVCRQINTCAVMNTDTLFATDRSAITSGGRNSLAKFFSGAGATSYVIVGHTDSRASDEYNMRLSERRAKAVASVAQSTGVRISDVRWYGERQPKASNSTAAGRKENRRVEVLCIR